jgi:hypothetical protein
MPTALKTLELLFYFRNMPTGFNDLLNYFSISGTYQLDTVIFGQMRM